MGVAAAVVTVSVEEAGGIAWAGEKAAVAPGGNPEMLRLIGKLNCGTGVSETEYVAVVPGRMF